MIDNITGATRYYEYGRYDSQRLGWVNKVDVPNVVIDRRTKMPTQESLKPVLSKISRISGQNGNIEGVYIKNDNYQQMVNYAENRMDENTIPNRKPYSIWTNNCGHFMQSVLESGGVYTPFYIDPRPNSYISELQDMNLFFWNNYINIEYFPSMSSGSSGGGPIYFGIPFSY